MADMILVASVQHTGTWSAIGMIEHMTGEKVCELWKILNGDPIEGILHTHIGDPMLVDTVERGKHVNGYILDALTTLFKTVIPVRDPMRSLITRQMRHPNLQHLHIIDGFRELARLHNTGNIYWLPLDLITEPTQQRSVENAMAAFVGAYPYVCSWTPVNQTYEQDEIRDAYAQGDIGPLEEACAEEVGALRSDKAINNFLRELNYDLPWME